MTWDKQKKKETIMRNHCSNLENMYQFECDVFLCECIGKGSCFQFSTWWKSKSEKKDKVIKCTVTMQYKPSGQVGMRGPVHAGQAPGPASVPPWSSPLSRSVLTSRPAAAPVLSLSKGKWKLCELTLRLMAASPQSSEWNQELSEFLNDPELLKIVT